MMRSIVWLALVLALGLSAARAEEPFSFADTPGELAKTVKPVAYRIDLVPDLEKLLIADGKTDVPFRATAEIEVDVLAATPAITLHALSLEFVSATVDGRAADLSLDSDQQTISLRVANGVAPGRHQLAFSYTGKINAQPNGLYYMLYDTPAGPRRMLSTHLEPSYARRMFPSFDEPAFKATFALSATVPANFQSVSNMPVVRDQPIAPARKRIAFATSPVMSSYLVVFVAGEMERIGRPVAGVDMGLLAPAGRVEQGRYALDEVAARVLPYYVDYFGVAYPLPKLDHIALPGGHDTSVAMENWGGITYTESNLLFDPATSSQSTREEIFLTVAHEISHQWFGNLVTPAWWDNLWLKEGFAMWMERKVADHFNPTWKMWLRAHASKETAMQADALRTTQAVQRQIANDSEAKSAFDDITYQKAPALVRMLEAYLGEAAFRDGLRRYMKAQAYGSATTADLWAALSEASGQPVASIAAGFTEQPGIPLIHVATACVDGQTVGTLRQERFTINHPYAEPRIWQVPVTLGRLGDPTSRQVLVGRKPEQVRFPGCGRPLKANLGNVGYYRVQYDAEGLQSLTATFPQLAPADRANLLADTWALVQAGRVEPRSYLDLMKALPGETELVVWESAIVTLGQIDSLNRGSASQERFRIFARALVQPLLDRLGWDASPGELPDSLMLRSLAISTLGGFDDPEVTAEARRRFAMFQADRQSLHTELRDPVLRIVGGTADRATFDGLLRLAREAQSIEERNQFYGALAHATDPALAEEAVALVTTDRQLPEGQRTSFLGIVAAASPRPEQIWQLVLKRREQLLASVSDGEKPKLLPAVARAVPDPQIAFQLKWADVSRSSPAARREADKAAEEIEFNADFKPRLVTGVERWLASAGYR